MELSDQDFLEICKTRIEEKYHLGNGERRLRQRDFEYLIDLIEEQSDIKLSISTLKRLWRETSEQNPHPTTLDALVSVLGYKDWLEFKIENAPKSHVDDSSLKPSHNRPLIANLWKKKPALIGFISLVVVAIIIISFTSKRTIFPSDAESVVFNVSNTVTAGVPNTVIFNYNLEEIEAEKYYIQQDWDPKNKREIDPDAGYFTSVYYYPGFHKARIIADETVLKIEDVFIQTEGWLAAAVHEEDQDHPFYLSPDYSQEGILTVSENILLNSGIDPKRFGGTGFFNMKDFNGLDAHNFIVETRFRNRPLVNTSCPFLQFMIHTEANVYFLQFTSKGCVGEVNLMIGENYISGKENDLSAFGVDLSEWQELELAINNKLATVSLNGQNVYESGFENNFGKVVGVDYRFSGMGELDYLRFKKPDDTIVFEDDF